MKFARIALSLALLVFVPLSANAQSTEEIDAYINDNKTKVAAQFGVGVDTAADYLRTASAAVKARMAAEQDKTEVSRLYAEVMEGFSQVQILGARSVVKGTALLEKMKDGTPGTPIPAALVGEINQWASFSARLLPIAAGVDVKAVEWSQKRALQAPVCRLHTPDFAMTKCLDLLKASVDLTKKITDHMGAMVKAIDVVKLTVSRMTY